MSLNFVALDFETTGLNFRTDQIIEACIVKVVEGEPIAVFNTLVYYDGELNPKVTEVTGHTSEDLLKGIPEEALARILFNFIGSEDEVLVAHNAMFDLSFLESLFLRHVVTLAEEGSPKYNLPNPFIDTLTIARDRKQYPHRLEPTCKHYGIELEHAHSAYHDTFALVDLVLAMHKEKDIEPYLNKAGYLRKYEAPEWTPAHAELYPQGKLPDVKHKANTKTNKLGRQIKRSPTPRVKPKKPEPVVVKDEDMPLNLQFHKDILDKLEQIEKAWKEGKRSDDMFVLVQKDEVNAVGEYMAGVFGEQNVYSYEDAGEVIFEVVERVSNGL